MADGFKKYLKGMYGGLVKSFNGLFGGFSLYNFLGIFGNSFHLLGQISDKVNMWDPSYQCQGKLEQD